MSPILALSPFLLFGCGGGSGAACTADIVYIPNAAYAGTFEATATSTGAEGSDYTFRFSVAADGTVTGTETDYNGTNSAALSGTAANLRSGCDDTKAVFVLRFTPADGAMRTLTVTKKRTADLRGSYLGLLQPAYAADPTVAKAEGLIVNVPSS